MTGLFKTIDELQDDIAANPESVVASTKQVLTQLGKLGRKLNAVSHIAIDETKQRAENLRDRLVRGQVGETGALYGIPVAHKDLFMRTGWPCDGGSRTLAGHVARQTAFAIERLDRHGAVDCGRLTSVELALGTTGHNDYAGTPTNPWNPQYICGGSSSGSAAVVAAGIVPASLGTDTGGSVRLPAAACGLVGIKPTHGLVGRSGVFALSPSLDCVGSLTRSVRDGATVLQAIAATDERDTSSITHELPDLANSLESGIAGLRAGWPANHFFEDVEASVADDIDGVFRLMNRLGAQCLDIEIPGIETANAMNMLITAVEGASLHHARILEHHGDLEAQTLARLLVGCFVPANDYYKALANRACVARRILVNTFSRVDVVITPVWPYPLPTIAESDAGARPEAAAMVQRSGHNTRPVNYLGFPAVNLPIGFDANGLPVSVQLVGAPYTEPMLLRTARAIERELNFWSSRPGQR